MGVGQIAGPVLNGGNGSAPRVATAYPWIALGLAVVLLFINNANNSTFGVFFKPIAGEFSWSRGEVSAAIALRWVVAACLVMPMGHLSDRYGPRRVLLPSFFLIGGGFLLTSEVTALWQFYLVQGLIMGAGTAGPWVCLMSTVARWQNKRRGLVLGIASTGTGLGAFFFPPLTASLIETIGWQQASIALGLVTLVFAVPASMFVKDPPPARNPSLDAVNVGLDSDGQGGNQGPFEFIRSFLRLLQNRQFLSLFMVFFLFYIGCNLVINHLVNYATDSGIGTLVAATMMSVVGITSVAGRLAMGPISDRIGTRADAAVCCSLVITALVLLMFKVESLMWVSVVLFGVGFGGSSPLVTAITGDHFGTKHLAAMTGAILVGGQLGSGIGPWMGGFIFDLTGSYLWALILSAVLTAAGLVIVLRLPPQPKE